MSAAEDPALVPHREGYRLTILHLATTLVLTGWLRDGRSTQWVSSGLPETIPHWIVNRIGMIA